MIVEAIKKNSLQATIIPISISSDQMIMRLSHGNQILWPVIT